MEPGFTITVNGVAREVAPGPERSLLEVLREELGITGPKLGCGEGACGAYFVLALDAASVPRGPINPVTAEELHEVVGRYWAIDEIRPARIHASVPGNFEAFRAFGDIREEGSGRCSVPG